MDNSSEQVAVSTADVVTGQMEGKPVDAPQVSVDQSETPVTADQSSDMKPELTALDSEEQNQASSAVEEQAAEPKPSVMDTETPKSPVASTDPVLTAGEAPSSKLEVQVEKAAEMAETPSLLTPGLSQDNDSQTGLPRDTQRSRSQSTGGSSVKSGGSSASALPENVPRVGGVRCCKSTDSRYYSNPKDLANLRPLQTGRF